MFVVGLVLLLLHYYVPRVIDLPVRQSDSSRKTHQRHSGHATGGKFSSDVSKSHGALWKHAITNLDELQMKGLSTNTQGQTGTAAGGAVNIREDWKEESTSHETESLENSLQMQFSHVDTLLTRLLCPSIDLVDHVVSSHTSMVKERKDHFDSVVEAIQDGMEANDDDIKIREACALLLLEKAFLHIVMDTSKTTAKSIWNGFGPDEGNDEGDSDVYQHDAFVLLNRILSQALDESNMFVGKGHFARHGFSQRHVNHAFAKLANVALRSARQLITRPLLLQPQHSIHKHEKSGTVPDILEVLRQCTYDVLT